MRHLLATAAACALTAVSIVTAHAHATLEVQQAPANSYYKVVLRTPHGCSGSPTIAVRLQIPEGVTGAKPQPKWGWELETVTEELASSRRLGSARARWAKSAWNWSRVGVPCGGTIQG